MTEPIETSFGQTRKEFLGFLNTPRATPIRPATTIIRIWASGTAGWLRQSWIGKIADRLTLNSLFRICRAKG